MESKYYSLIRMIDMFGVPPLFTIRGHQTFQTSIGAILTIICIFLMLIYISYFVNQMITHSDPNILSTIYNEENPLPVYLSNKNFSFAFGLQNEDYTNYIDESIYNINAIQTKVYLKNNNESEIYNKPINIIRCNEFSFHSIPEYFDQLPLKDLYCLNNSEYELEGEYKREIFSYLKLNFTKCINSTSNNFTCKSNERINEILAGGYWGIFMNDYNVVPRQYKFPYKIYGKNIYNGFSIDYFEDILFFLKTVEIITDSGYLFEDNNNLKFSVYDYFQSNIVHKHSNNFLSFTIRLSSKSEVYERSYIKIQTIFSNFGGMLKIILLFGEYSIYFIRMTLYKNYILEFFNMDESEIRLKKVREKYTNIRKHLSSISKINFFNSSGLSINSFNNENKSIHNNNPNNSYSLNNNYINSNKINSNNNNNNNRNSNNNNVRFSNQTLNKPRNKTPENKFSNRKTNTFIVKKENIKFQKLGSKNLLSPSYTSPHYLYNSPRKSWNDLFEKTQSKYFLRQTTNVIKEQNNDILRRKSFYEAGNNVFNGLNAESNKELNGINKQSTINIIGSSNKLRQLREISLPKTKVRIIKIPSFWSDFLCKKNTFQTIKQVHDNFKEIQFLLDIVHYLKSENTLNIVLKYFFDEEQRKVLSYTYSFEADFKLEREGYDYMIKHEKNKFDDKDENETSQKSLLQLQ